MIKRMVTRLIIAQLIPVAINAGKKAFRKKKPAANPRPTVGDVNNAPKQDTVEKPID